MKIAPPNTPIPERVAAPTVRSKSTPWGKAYLAYTRTGMRWYVHVGARIVPLARLIWCEANGVSRVPRDCVIHHRNECSWDDRVDNLQCMTRGDHTRLHMRGVYRSHVMIKGVGGKVCAACGVFKPLRMFPGNGTSSTGSAAYRPTCKTCYAHAIRAQRQAIVAP